MNTHEYFMNIALREAQRAFDEGEVPVGAVVVAGSKILGKGYNQTERLGDPTAHAEMLAITAATDAIGAKYLKDCSLYVTLEPCVMCAGAIFWAQVGQLVIGAPDTKRGYLKHGDNLLHPKTEVVKYILQNECSILLTEFFSKKRA